ncbi:baseplate J/gp47 family protein [Candidatus Albibeggiatoa sp. nov. NOAA]|uniref:baseplate assembly protein n=1 Tax=Candidatus Albibeggiatoa sp. nov. NOAA TaxID=3162724 RepID=UPI0033050922|nr:baseplate J/gp47 family protein [Thiotrichaceae bacterium]
MSAFSNIELEKLPFPDVIEALDIEQLVAQAISEFRNLAPDYQAIVESDPAYKLLEQYQYRELLLRQRINDASKAVMLAYAKDADLDNLAANIGVARLEGETDERLRTRTVAALEAISTCGATGSYVYWTLTASNDVKDVDVFSPEPSVVEVTVLSVENNGFPSDALLQIVDEQLSAEDKRPLTDEVVLKSPEITEYEIDATLYFYNGPDPAVVKAESIKNITEYVQKNHLLGHDIALSGIYAALHGAGVQRIELHQPTDTIVVDRQQAAFCRGINVVSGGVDE